jgi:hypothetical protein
MVAAAVALEKLVIQMVLLMVAMDCYTANLQLLQAQESAVTMPEVALEAGVVHLTQEFIMVVMVVVALVVFKLEGSKLDYPEQ